MTMPSTWAEAVASRSFMAGRPIDRPVSFHLFEQASLLQRGGRLRYRRGAQARVPDDLGPRRRALLADHLQHVPLVDLGDRNML